MLLERCIWAVLRHASNDLRFVATSTLLYDEISLSDFNKIAEKSFFDYIHPEERNAARADILGEMAQKSLNGTITR